MTQRVVRAAVIVACTIALLAIVARIALPQAVSNPSNPTSTPNQINVTNGYLYLNKLHYAGAYSSVVTYSSQDLVISASLPYISLIAGNLNNTPASSPTAWFALPAGAAVATWGSVTGTLSAQTDLNTALGLALAKASNLSDLTNAATARTSLGLAAVAASGSASDLASGTLDHARLPSLVSGDIPNNAANTSGLAATASALASTPTLCTTGQAPTGVMANGNATGCAAASSGQQYVATGASPVTLSTSDTVVFVTGTLPALAAGGSALSCWRVSAYVRQISSANGIGDVKLWYGTAPGTTGSVVESTLASGLYASDTMQVQGRICNQNGSQTAQDMIMMLAGWSMFTSNFGIPGLAAAGAQTTTGASLKIGITMQSHQSTQAVTPVSFEVDLVR